MTVRPIHEVGCLRRMFLAFGGGGVMLHILKDFYVFFFLCNVMDFYVINITD